MIGISISIHKIIRLIKRVLYFCVFYTNLVHFLQIAISAILGGGIRILCFHRVIGDDDKSSQRSYSGHLTRSKFEKLIKYLTKHYKIISLEECVQLLRGNRRLPTRFIVITFDDGYADNFYHAYPILSQYRVPATFFISTGAIGTTDSLWFQRVYNIFSRTSLESVTIDWLGKTFTWGQDVKARSKTMGEVTKSLKVLCPEEREKRIDALRELMAVTTDKPHELDRMLSWEEVIEMDRDPLVSIGSHTVTHSILSTIPEESEVWREIYGSLCTIEQELGHRPKLFSDPNGNDQNFNKLHERLVNDAGFICACSLASGLNNHGTNIYKLKRTCISSNALYRNALNIAGVGDISTSIRNKISRILGNSTCG